MQTTVSTKGQVTLPVEVREELGIGAGTVLEIERGAGGSIVLRKRAVSGFFDQFVGARAKHAPFASGDEAREALRVAEDEAPYSAKRPRRKS